MTEINLHIVARMADYMYTHPYTAALDPRLQSTRDAGYRELAGE